MQKKKTKKTKTKNQSMDGNDSNENVRKRMEYSKQDSLNNNNTQQVTLKLLFSNDCVFTKHVSIETPLLPTKQTYTMHHDSESDSDSDDSDDDSGDDDSDEDSGDYDSDEDSDDDSGDDPDEPILGGGGGKYDEDEKEDEGECKDVENGTNVDVESSSSSSNNSTLYIKNKNKNKKTKAKIHDILLRLQYEYTFIKRLSKSKRYVVYKAQDHRTSDLVVLKIRYQQILGSDPVEVRVLSKLIKVNYMQQLIRYHRFKDAYVIVSKFEENVHYDTDDVALSSSDDSSLSHMNNVKVYMKQLLESLEYLHNHGIIHRDIKTSNILWNLNKMKITILDFDLSTFGQNATHTRYVGTEGYIAPEILTYDLGISFETYDQKVDIWSAGIVFAQLLFRIPERELTRSIVRAILQICNNKKQSRIKIPPDVDSNAIQVLSSMLQENPSQRSSIPDILSKIFFM